MNNELNDNVRVSLTRAETPDEVLKGIETVPKVLGTYKGSKLTKMPEILITDEEHEEIVDKTITRVLEKL